MKTRRWGRHGSIVALVCALAWGIAPGSLAEESPSELDAATRARLEAIRDRISELLAETPSAQREAVRQELLRALETTDPRLPEPGAAPAEGVASRELRNDRPVESSPPSEVASTSESVAVPEVVPAAESEGQPASATPAPDTAGASSEPATTTEVAATPPPPAAAPPVAPQRRARAPRCTTLLSFDENGDGKINAQDRWWRYLYVWVDRNGDRQTQEREVESVYERGVREIDAGLDGFYRKKGSLGEVRYDDTIVLDLGGDGFGAGRRPDDGTLAVDATALRRGTGPSLESGGGPVEGIQPFRQGQHLVFDDGRRVELSCRRR